MKRLIMILAFLIIPSTSFAMNDIDEIGFDLFYGKGKTTWGQQLSSSFWHSQIVGGMFRLGKYLNEDWGLMSDVGVGYRYNTTVNDGHEVNGHEINMEIRIRQYFLSTDYTRFYLGIIVGLSSMFPSGQPKYGNSGILGTIGGMIGTEIPISTNWATRFEMIIDHTSDPLQNDDSGRNFEKFSAGLVYRF